jgi:hypothetical protein
MDMYARKEGRGMGQQGGRERRWEVAGITEGEEKVSPKGE